MSVTIELPRYQCHKQVWALKISHVEMTTGGYYLGFEDQRYAPVHVAIEWVEKHKPYVGGYFVVYADGYRSYSPAKAFEEGYSLIAHNEDELEQLYWEFDAERNKSGQERLTFKNFLAAYAQRQFLKSQGAPA